MSSVPGSPSPTDTTAVSDAERLWLVKCYGDETLSREGWYHVLAMGPRDKLLPDKCPLCAEADFALAQRSSDG